MADNKLLNLLDQNGLIAFSTEQLLKSVGYSATSVDVTISKLASPAGEFFADGNGGWMFRPFSGWDGTLNVSFDVTDGDISNSYNTGLTADDVASATGSVLEGSSRSERLTGTDAADTIIGGAGDDLLEGGAGDDVFLVGSGDGTDRIVGGEGYDVVRGTSQDDTIALHSFEGDNRVEEIDGGDGNDTVTVRHNADFSQTQMNSIEGIEGSTRDNRISGSQGADTIDGKEGSDVLSGNDGDDVFLKRSGDGEDRISGGDGYDKIQATDADDTIALHSFEGANRVEEIDGGAGNDTVTVKHGADFSDTQMTGIEGIEGSTRDNRISGSQGADTIDGKEGADVLSGNDGDDVFLKRSGDGADRISGGDGYDKIQATDADDTIALHSFEGDNRVEEIDGGAGDDTVTVTHNADFSDTQMTGIEGIEGSARGNRITGSQGDDVIDGKGGSDAIFAESGDDVLVFAPSDNGTEIDRFDGGSGSDTLRLNLTGAEAANSALMAEIEAFRAFMSGSEAQAGATFKFTQMGLEAKNIENLQVTVDGVLQAEPVIEPDVGAIVQPEPEPEEPVVEPDPVPVNEAPVVGETAFTMSEDGTLTVTEAQLLANATDADGDALSVSAVSASEGSLTDNGNGSWTFTPDADWNGELSLSYSVSDGEATTPVTAKITVDAVNDAATVSAAPTFSLAEDGSIVISEAQLLANATDVDGDQLSLTSLSVDQGSLANNGNGTWTFTPAANWNGEVAMSYGVSDGQAVTQVAAKITVDAVNDAATLSGAPEFQMNEDGSLVITADQLLSTASDVDGDSLSVEGLSADHGTLTDNGNGSWTFTPDADWNGEVALSYSVSDGQASVAANAKVTVDAQNDSAVMGQASSYEMDEDGSLTLTSEQLLQGASDVDGDQLSVTAVTTDQGTVTDNGDGSWTFTPAADWNGQVALSYDVTDGKSNTPVSTSISVRNVNDAAVVTAATVLVMAEDGSLNIAAGDLLKHAVDADGDALSISGLSADQGSLTDNGNGNWTFTPDADWNGQVTLSYGISDGQSVVQAGAQIDVQAVNDAAQVGAINDFTMDQDGQLVISAAELLANASDVDGDNLTVASLVSDQGSVTDNGDGTWTFTPDQSWTGDVQLNYQVSDGTSLTAASVGLSVTPTYDSVIEGRSSSEGLHGTAGDDLIIGNGGDDVMYGNAGDDTFQKQTGDGVDRVVGGEGFDRVIGTSADDTIALHSFEGDNRVEQIDGGAGTDKVTVEHGADFSETEMLNMEGIEGSSRGNNIIGSQGDDTIDGKEGSDVLYGEGGDDTFLKRTGDDADRIIGGEGYDRILATNADDTIALHSFGGENHVEEIDGGEGNDTLTVEHSADFTNTTLKGIETIQGSSRDSSIMGSKGDDTIDGGDGVDVLGGGEGDDTFLKRTGDGAERISGGAGYDRILGTSSDDTISLHSFEGDNQVEEIDGGAGTDTVSVEYNADFSSAVLKDIEAIDGSSRDNVITGSNEADVINGLDGNDKLAGAGGNDFIDGGAGSDTVVFGGSFLDYSIDFNDNGTVTITDLRAAGTDGVDVVQNVEFLQFADQKLEATELGVEIAKGQASIPSAPSAPAAPHVSGNLTNPDMVDASASGGLVSLKFQNNESTDSDGGYVTLGHVFGPGDIMPGESLMATIDGQQVSIQMDVKATNDDGSVRHAILTVDSPAVPAGGEVDIVLSKTGDPAASGSVSIADILAGGYDLDVDLVMHDGGTDTPVHIDAAQVLADALANGNVSTWIDGPLASEYSVTAPVNELMDVTFNIRAFADGTVMTDVVFAADKAFTAGNDNLNYDVKITEGGQVTFEQANLDHHHKGTWHSEVWSGQDPDLHVVRDMDYMLSTGAVPNYDVSQGISGGSLNEAYNQLLQADTGPMGAGTVHTYMPGTGGRPDLGALPTWAVQYLASQDEHAEEILFANADASGSIPWHFRDENTGNAISIDDYPNLWLDSRGGTTVLPDKFSVENTGWDIDTAHMPSLTYLPYLLTGSQYYLEEMQAQATYQMAQLNPGYRGDADGLVGGQVRAQAWALRDISDTAYITPDSDPQKSYFEEKLDNNLQNYLNTYVNNANPDAEMTGFVVGDNGSNNGWLTPWQDDYFTVVLSSIVERGNDDAATLAQWKADYTAGRFLAEDMGMVRLAGTAYTLRMYEVVDGEWVWFTTWDQVMHATFVVEGKEIPTELDYPEWAGGYSGVVRAALATMVTQDQPGALEAYGYVVGETPLLTADYADNPTFSIVAEIEPGEKLLATDMMVGGDSDDVLEGDAANELLHGGGGNDFILGQAGLDALFGGEGNDQIDGGEGNDHLYGNEGDDTLVGGAGNDVIKGGKGADVLTGGEGEDTFIYDRLTEGGDSITDFTIGEDVLDLREVMTIAGVNAQINVTQGNDGAEIWLNDTDNGDLLLTTLLNINADQINMGTDIWFG